MSLSAGKRLATAREARGWSIEDITREIKIRPNLLRALEEDDYTQFGSITHARNFLSLYSRHLKLDFREELAQLATPAKISVADYQYLNIERNDIDSFRTVRTRRPTPGDPVDFPFKTVFSGLAILAVAVTLGYLIINLQRLNLTSTNSREAVVEASPTPTPTAPPTPTPVPSPTPETQSFSAPVTGRPKWDPTPTVTPF